jgi:hypothetical protein
MNPELQKAIGVTLEAREPKNRPSSSLAARAVGGVDRFALHPAAGLKAGYDALTNRPR